MLYHDVETSKPVAADAFPEHPSMVGDALFYLPAKDLQQPPRRHLLSSHLEDTSYLLPTNFGGAIVLSSAPPPPHHHHTMQHPHPRTDG